MPVHLFICRSILVLLLLVPVSKANADVVADLYQSRQLVSDKMLKPDQQTLLIAVEQVLKKVAGRGSVTALSSSIKGDVSSLVDSFTLESTLTVRTDSQRNDYLAQELICHFNPTAINSLLRGNGFEPVGKYRPTSIVWLVSGDESARSLELVKKSLLNYASDVAFPIEVFINDDFGFKQAVATESWPVLARYTKAQRGSLAFIGEHLASGNNRWMFVDGELSHSNEYTGPLEKQYHLLFAWMANAAGLKAQIDGREEGKPYQVTVTNVKNISDYMAIMDYIRALSSISRVSVESMVEQTMVITLVTHLQQKELIRVVNLNRRLVMMRALNESDKSAMRWRWFSTRR